MKPKSEQYEEDDDLVVCDMNVEGMPWYKRNLNQDSPPPAHKPQLTRSEAWRYNWYAILAGMLIVLVFSLTWVLFVLFCTQIWFR